MWEEAADALRKQWQYHLYNCKISPVGKTIRSNLKLIQHLELEFHSRCPSAQLCI